VSKQSSIFDHVRSRARGNHRDSRKSAYPLDGEIRKLSARAHPRLPQGALKNRRAKPIPRIHHQPERTLDVRESINSAQTRRIFQQVAQKSAGDGPSAFSRQFAGADKLTGSGGAQH